MSEIERSRKRGRGAELSQDHSIDRGQIRGGSSKSGNRVFVSNIPYEYSWQDLKDLFRKQVGDVSFVELLLDSNEKSRGCGVVEFADVESVKKCVELMNRYDINGRKLVVKEDVGGKYGNNMGPKRQREHEDGRDRRGRDERRNFVSNRSNQDTGNTFGLSPQFLESLGIGCPLINRVFVANLDYKVDRRKLKEVFRLAGKIHSIVRYEDKEGKSRGIAVIEYDHPVEAVQAISMFHNQLLYDRVMTVRMDREGDQPVLKLPEGLKSIGMGLGTNGDPLRDVARNLPSLNSSSAGVGSSILGPISNLGFGGTLGNLTSAASALNNSAVLRAANLSGISSNLLSNSLSGGDLGLASLVQNQSLAAFGNLGGNNNQGSRSYLGGSHGFDQKSSNFERDGLSGTGSQNLYSSGSANNGTAILRTSSVAVGGGKGNSFSNQILISNLPPTASYKLLSEKCNEFGEVQHIEDKGSNGVLVSYGSDWEAERAIKNMDRARIDGRTIDVRFYN